jgi:hypothetical protein
MFPHLFSAYEFDEDGDHGETEHEHAYLTRINREMRAKFMGPFFI